MSEKSGTIHTSLEQGSDPPDVMINGSLLAEVVEVLPPQRRQQQEIKDWLLRCGRTGTRLGIVVPPQKYSRLEIIKPIAGELIKKTIQKKYHKYQGISSSKQWVLLVYVNLPWASRLDWSSIVNELRCTIPQETAHFREIHLLWHGPNGCGCMTL